MERISSTIHRSKTTGLPGLPVVMRVKETEPVVGGVGSHYKPATMEGPARLETGLIVQVPWFISPGDWIRVNTANGEYIERV